jgi:hypothetical protein
MKQVFTDPSVIPCDMLKSVLDCEGIPAMIRNEWGALMVGYGLPIFGCPSLPWAWPEVWVRDEDCDRALKIAADFESTSSGDSRITE